MNVLENPEHASPRAIPVIGQKLMAAVRLINCLGRDCWHLLSAEENGVTVPSPLTQNAKSGETAMALFGCEIGCPYIGIGDVDGFKNSAICCSGHGDLPDVKRGLVIRVDEARRSLFLSIGKSGDRSLLS